MLHFIRERAQGWVAWFIVGLITIPFALWGVNSYLTGPSDIVVASVNGEAIKQAEFQKALQQYRDRMRDVMADNFDPSLFDNVETKRDVLGSLIDQKLLYSVSQSLGLRISNNDINQIIRATPSFQVDGQFDMERYKMLLARAAYTPARYEQQLRTDLLTKELTNTIQQTALVTNNKIDNLLRLEKQKRDIAYGVIAVAPLAKAMTVNEQEVALYYDDNKERYTSPERVSFDYVELSVVELAKKIEFDDAELQQFFSDNSKQFVSPEQRRASHILIESGDEALTTLGSIQQRLVRGDDFAELAKEFSSDTGSATAGGDLGLFGRDVMDPAFEQAVFALTAVGDVTEPVKTEFGYHLIKLTAIETPKGKSFADSREEVEVTFRRQQAEQVFYEQADQLAELSYENPDNLDLVAQELSLEIKTSDVFTREGGQGLVANNKVVNIAFSDEVVVDDLNSAVIELTKSHLVVLHKKQYIAESQLPYEVVSAAIKEILQLKRARKQASVKGAEFIEKLESGMTAETVFADDEWQTNQIISRLDTDLNREVMEFAYTIKKPSNSPVYSGFTASNGNYIIVKLNEVIDGNAAEATELDRSGLAAYLSRSQGDNELRAFLASLKADADIEIYEQYIK